MRRSLLNSFENIKEPLKKDVKITSIHSNTSVISKNISRPMSTSPRRKCTPLNLVSRSNAKISVEFQRKILSGTKQRTALALQLKSSFSKSIRTNRANKKIIKKNPSGTVFNQNLKEYTFGHDEIQKIFKHCFGGKGKEKINFQDSNKENLRYIIE